MKFLHSAFIAAPTLLRNEELKFSSSALRSSVSHFNVGGNKFTIDDEDVRKHPASLLFQLTESTPVVAGVKEIEINRSGALFKYVNAFLVTGQLPRNDEGYIALDEKTLADLHAEAEFYRLQTLSNDCKVHRKMAPDLQSYMTIRRYLQDYRCGDIEFEKDSKLSRILQSFQSPFCVKGTSRVCYLCRDPLFKSTTETCVNVEELIAAATQSPFGRGTETVIDTDVRNSYEIESSQLNPAVLNKISQRYDNSLKELAPHLDLSLRPYKLVIYKEGGHFDAHRDTVRGDGHIGTFVVVLNSTYTGGELEVTHGGRIEVVTGPYSWVAMYGDCLHKINPVTSGTRVSLIFDIYASKDETSVASQDKNFKPFSVREEEKKRMLWESLDNELSNYDSIIICLEHLYPECQTNPSFLKGGDRALYERLRENEAFDVEVVAATIYRHDDNRTDPDKTSDCALFSPTIVQRAMGILPYKPYVEEKTKLVMSGKLSDDKLLDYSPYISQTGNDAQDGYSFYIVAGLQVRRKKG